MGFSFLLDFISFHFSIVFPRIKYHDKTVPFFDPYFDLVVPVRLCPHLTIATNELKSLMKFRCGRDTGENTEIAFPGFYLPSKLSMMQDPNSSWSSTTRKDYFLQNLPNLPDSPDLRDLGSQTAFGTCRAVLMAKSCLEHLHHPRVLESGREKTCHLGLRERLGKACVRLIKPDIIDPSFGKRGL